MTEREALKMCLEYIETDAHERKYVRHAIKEALSQPEPEYLDFMDTPQRTWVGLTDEEIQYCVELKNPEAIAEEVEAKLKEKNT